MSIESINPYTNASIATFDALDQAQIDKRLNNAETAFRGWRSVAFDRRSELMHAAGDELENKKGHYAELMIKEMGKARKEAIAEIEKCAWVCHFYADHAERMLQSEKLESDGSEAALVYDPMGPVLAVMPWNFPYWQVFRFAAPALMAGNVGVLKHASNVPQCALAIEEVFKNAGFPENVFQTLLIESSQVETVIKHPAIKAVTLTGSEAAGKSVAAMAGSVIKKTVLELGGSDPFIVLADADIAAAAKTAVKSRMINAGQSCIAAKRFIVEEAVSNDFLEKLIGALKQLKGGDPEREDTDFGPQAREDLAEQLEKQVQVSITKGAELVFGNKPMREGTFFHPVVLKNVKPGMPAYDEELFGPVFTVLVAQDTEEAVRIANDSLYGLGASLWSKDTNKAKEIARLIDSGNVFINGLVKSDPRLPFGGIKLSGYGRELSHLGIREFMNQKTVWVG